MRLLDFAAAIAARSTSQVTILVGKAGKSREIVNFMNFTSGQSLRTRAGAIA